MHKVRSEGGAALDIRGQYGEGKTFTLSLTEQMALEAGYMTTRIEVDATENRLDKPHNIYRELLANLRIPQEGPPGARGIVLRTAQAIRHVATAQGAAEQAVQRRKWLLTRLECEPISWLFSDPECASKEELIGLFAGRPVATARSGRQQHILGGGAREWPTFSYGTQGDIASYLLSGLGRFALLLRLKGLVIILDEMERWQDLDWTAQTRAGNLLGGLIWAATSPEGKRRCVVGESRFADRMYGRSCDHATILGHSGWAGGYPFTTRHRCFLGVAVAMTPRGFEGPGMRWKEYGDIQVVDLPQFNQRSLRGFFETIVPWFKKAYGVTADVPTQVFTEAMNGWRSQGVHSARSGVTAVLDALYSWLSSNGFGVMDGVD